MPQHFHRRQISFESIRKHIETHRRGLSLITSPSCEWWCSDVVASMTSSEFISERREYTPVLKGNKFLSDELGRGAHHRRSFDSNVTIWILNYCYVYAGCTTLVHPWVRDSWPRGLLCFALSHLFPFSRLILESLDKFSRACILLNHKRTFKGFIIRTMVPSKSPWKSTIFLSCNHFAYVHFEKCTRFILNIDKFYFFIQSLIKFSV